MPSAETRVASKAEMIRALQDEMPCLRERFGVVRLALYGSFARGEQTEESDVDILVELSRPLGLEFVQLACYLEEKLGRRVDLATFDSLHRTSRKPYRQLVAESILEDLLDVETAAR